MVHDDGAVHGAQVAFIDAPTFAVVRAVEAALVLRAVIRLARAPVPAFQDAGAAVSSLQDILDLGAYLTTAVKCGKTGYGIATATIERCSHILEQELALFPQARVLLLMGDVAIKAVNGIARRAKEPRVIPAGSTYKLRGQAYTWRGMRAFPSYLQAGPSFFIEKSKRKMIAEDIAAALEWVRTA
jgi:uracil-DNA glycosylase